jgi:hypothetical protein
MAEMVGLVQPNRLKWDKWDTKPLYFGVSHF